VVHLILEIGSKSIDFHQLTDNSLNSILIIGTDGEIFYSNKSCLDLFKLTHSKDILNKKVWSFLPPSFHDISKERLIKVLKNQEIIKSEVKMIRADGEIIDVEAMTAPFYLENQILAQVFLQDITQRKVAERRLTEREKLASLGQIAAGIAHEIKNPLTAVRGFLQLIKESDSNPYFDIMESELEKALNTVQDLLQVSKPDLHDEPLVDINLCNELNSLISLFQEKLYIIEIEVNLIDSDLKIVGKKNLLQKAFFNLIKNAVEAIEGKGKITIDHFYKDERIHVKISDTGVGIPQEKIKMLGTPFFSNKIDGTGLGLTQVFTTIHEHNGSISIESEVTKGTTFHIQLPFRKID
jgi:two-component system, sporulation sensor kinase A